MNKLTNFKINLFMGINNLFLYIIIGFDHSIDTFKNNTWYVPIISFIMYTILIILLPKKIFNSLPNIMHSWLSRFILFLYLTIRIIITVLFGSIFFKSYFDLHFPIFVFSLITIITGIFVSSFSFENLINTSSIFFIIVILTCFIPIISGNTRHYEYLLPVSFSSQYLYIPLIMISIPIDNLLFSFYAPQIIKGFNKSNLIIGGLILNLISIFLFTECLTLISPIYYQNKCLMGFYNFLVYNSNRYFSNQDPIVLAIMIISIVFNTSFHFLLLRIILPKTKLTNIYVVATIILIVTNILYYTISNNFKIINISSYVIFIFAMAVYIIINYYNRRIIYDHQRSNK